MLYFIVPLKGRAASHDWDRVSRLCRRTLASLDQQTSREFRIFLICTDVPTGLPSHTGLEIIRESFPPPAPNKQAQIADKAAKVRRGLMAVRERGGGFVMGVDADDLVHHDLAALAAAHPQSHGWMIRSGYSYDEGSRWLEWHNDFHLRCGSSHIIRFAREELPEDLAGPAENSFALRHGHHTIAAYLAAIGRPLSVVPFPGAIYVKMTGENNTGPNPKSIGIRATVSKALRTRPVTPAIRKNFNLRPL
ncbi:MAG: glycosyltransferase family 2 protein [Verrucomicrobia bacterium]|nr:glycosyltransferase family 2 protein [Verrucomicrobiota bacterium]